MTQATVSESCKGLHNALTNAIARRLPLGIARPLRIVRVRTYQKRNGLQDGSEPQPRHRSRFRLNGPFGPSPLVPWAPAASLHSPGSIYLGLANHRLLDDIVDL